MTAMPAPKALDTFFLEARNRLLDIAAILDRLDRGDNATAAVTDPRVERIRQALAVLMAKEPGRAEAIQKLFSLEYDPAWPKPSPRY
ncbi:hypothetical protein BH11PLA2_BH11PLA2_13690 [soil metagenome]